MTAALPHIKKFQCGIYNLPFFIIILITTGIKQLTNNLQKTKGCLILAIVDKITAVRTKALFMICRK